MGWLILSTFINTRVGKEPKARHMNKYMYAFGLDMGGCVCLIHMCVCVCVCEWKGRPIIPIVNNTSGTDTRWHGRYLTKGPF